MGHTFLFRGSPRGRADGIDRWLTLLGMDAALLADCTGDVRSLAPLAQRFESLSAERGRKGRAKDREAVIEAIEMLLSREQASLVRGSSALYPSLLLHLRRKARYALRMARADGTSAIGGAPAMKEAAFCLSLVKETAELCPQYLDPSERVMTVQARMLEEALADICGRAAVYGALGGDAGGYEAFLAEADEMIGTYRRFLAELDSRREEGRLMAVFPSAFLVWADGTCAAAHHWIKRVMQGKTVPDIAEEAEEETSPDALRTQEPMPLVVLAENAEEDSGAAVHEAETADDAAETASDAADDTAETKDDAEIAEECGSPTVQRIYAKASDYKNVVEKAVQKQKERRSFKPRPLGRRQ